MKLICQKSCECKGSTQNCDECTCWPDILIWGRKYKDTGQVKGYGKYDHKYPKNVRYDLPTTE